MLTTSARNPQGARTHGVALTTDELRQHQRGAYRPRHFHMRWQQCIKTTCGFYSIDRACGGRRALGRLT